MIRTTNHQDRDAVVFFDLFEDRATARWISIESFHRFVGLLDGVVVALVFPSHQAASQSTRTSACAKRRLP